jgi:hypothetical protein
MQFLKAQQGCQSFLDSFIAGLSLKGIANLFGATCFYFFSYKSLGKQAWSLEKIGAKRHASGMDSELKSSHSFLKNNINNCRFIKNSVNVSLQMKCKKRVPVRILYPQHFYRKYIFN